MEDLSEQSIALHRANRGKLAVKSKTPVATPADLALVYTPGVGAVVKAIATNPSEARELTIKRNTVAVVTDGSAILGFGNLGPLAALPVMEGKAILFKELADVDAWPIVLDTQDTEEIIKTVKYIAPGFGGINLEDIAAPKCCEIERRLRAELDIPVVHDDQHGTAVVVLAGLINALKLRGLDVADVKVVMSGAGAAGTAVARLLVAYGIKNLVVCDSRGAIGPGRMDLNEEKKSLLGITNPNGLDGSLGEVLVGAEVFVGLSRAGILNAEMVGSMVERPVIFALANPEPEIMPDVAKQAGAYIVATGRSDFPNQINNSLVFPGLFRGLLDSGKSQVTEEILLAAAKALAGYMANPTVDQLMPSTLDKGVVQAVSQAVIDS
jgi:malate dehydrogenase (oxaloacetate-decarboxylating)